MYSWSLATLADWLGAPPPPQPGAPPQFSAAQFCTDTRALRPGDLFVALDGENYLGQNFLAAARAAGAAAAIVNASGTEAARAANLPAIRVANTTLALGTLAQRLRRAIGRPVAAVTGSNGKTTCKELLAAALASGGPVHKTAGNLNNFVGVPKTLFAWPESAWAAVVEMGMNAPGEIAYLTQVADPDVALVTCVAKAHLAGLGSLANVAQAKAELFATAKATATRVVNADDAVLVAAAAPYLKRGPVLRFGTQAGVDVRLLGCEDGQVPAPGGEGGVLGATVLGQRLELEVLGRKWTATLPLVGRHNALNAAGALAAALALGVAAEPALAGMAHTVLPHGRLALSRLAALDVDVVDDGYNANPGSMRAALQTVCGLAKGRRVVAVLGEMRELGPTAAALHAEVGVEAARAGVGVLFALGEHATAMVEAARAHGAQAHAFAELAPMLVALRAALSAKDWLLVKGSRGMRMERVLASLRGEAEPHPHG